MAAPIYRRSDVKVLTVDDDPSFNKLMSVYLKKLKYKFLITTTSEDFLTTLKDKPPHICFVDLNLDNRSGVGFQIIQAIRNKLGSDMPIIVLSARSADEDISKAFDCGATDYLSKPVTIEELDSKISLNLGQNF